MGYLGGSGRIVNPDLDHAATIEVGSQRPPVQARRREIPYPALHLGSEIPQQAVKYDKRRYRRRSRIEIMFGRLKDWRRVATRCVRCPTAFFSAVALAAIVISDYDHES